MLKSDNSTTRKKFLVPSKKVIKVINQNEILYVRAESNYSVIVLEDKTELMICKTLEKVEKSLNPAVFSRCHKSYLVNLSKIQEISRQNCAVVIGDNLRLPISRRRRKKFIQAIQDCFHIAHSIKDTFYSREITEN